MPKQPEAQKDAIKRKIGDAMRTRREDLGISQEDAARRCGVARSYYLEVERAKRNPTSTNLVRLAAGLELTAAELLERAGL